MAIPIKDTPVLKGKDSVAFSKQIAESSVKAITREQLTKLNQSHLKFQKLFASK